MIDTTFLNPESNAKIWNELKDILFASTVSEAHSPPPRTASNPEPDLDLYKHNYIFTRFDHLFDYEAGYHSYLIAKICSEDLYNNHVKGTQRQSGNLPKKIDELFSQGGAFDYRNNLL